MTTRETFRSHFPVVIVLLILAPLRYSLASGGGEEQAARNSISVSDQSAIARVNGRTLTVFPNGMAPQSRELLDEYLFAWPGSKGSSMAGWGFVRSNSAPPSRTGALILVSFNYGRDREFVQGFTDPSFVSISPDFRRLALIAENKVTHFRGLQIVDLSDAHRAEQAMQIEVQASGLDSYVAWSPDSTKLLFTVKNRIQLFDIESGTKHVLVLGTLPSWSSDGRLLAYFPIDSHLSIMELDTLRSTSLSRSERAESRASWAPDSRSFVVERNWGGKDRNKNCPTNSRLVEYRWPELTSAPIVDPCGLKPELFFWVEGWKRWLGN